MNVDYELLQRGCLMARENRLKQERVREATPERKARKYGYEVAFRARMKARRLSGEHTLWLMGGCVKVNMGRAA